MVCSMSFQVLERPQAPHFQSTPTFAACHSGSPEVGRLVASSCGANLVPVKLELGGKGAAVVFDDVDISDAAEKLVNAITFHTGQVCCDATRWLVQEPIYDEFVMNVWTS